MPSFDGGRRRVWLRIAVDGPVSSGKRTNLQQLCQFFTTRWQLDHAGREWLQVDGGVVHGLPVLCRVYNLGGLEGAGRKALLSDLDAAVFICSSTPEGARQAMPLLQRFVVQLPPRVPWVVQANKQDAANALSVDEIRRCLSVVAPAFLVIAARAIAGEGVRETLTEAIRLGVERIPEDGFPRWAQ
jgi:signal recognition particle receptor subunit beta